MAETAKQQRTRENAASKGANVENSEWGGVGGWCRQTPLFRPGGQRRVSNKRALELGAEEEEGAPPADTQDRGHPRRREQQIPELERTAQWGTFKVWSEHAGSSEDATERGESSGRGPDQTAQCKPV